MDIKSWATSISNRSQQLAREGINFVERKIEQNRLNFTKFPTFEPRAYSESYGEAGRFFHAPPGHIAVVYSVVVSPDVDVPEALRGHADGTELNCFYVKKNSSREYVTLQDFLESFPLWDYQVSWHFRFKYATPRGILTSSVQHDKALSQSMDAFKDDLANILPPFMWIDFTVHSSNDELFPCNANTMETGSCYSQSKFSAISDDCLINQSSQSCGQGSKTSFNDSVLPIVNGHIVCQARAFPHDLKFQSVSGLNAMQFLSGPLPANDMQSFITARNDRASPRSEDASVCKQSFSGQASPFELVDSEPMNLPMQPIVEPPPPQPNRADLVANRVAMVESRAQEKMQEAQERRIKEQSKQREKLLLSDDLRSQLDRWAKMTDGSYKDIRTLLSTVHEVLWEDAEWEPVSISTLMVTVNVKQHFRRALLMSHPDKHQNVSAERQYRAERIFQAFNESYKVKPF